VISLPSKELRGIMKRGQSLKSHQPFATWYGQTDLFSVEFMRISNYMRLFEDTNARNAIPKKGLPRLTLALNANVATSSYLEVYSLF
jgi:hypothetical protein